MVSSSGKLVLVRLDELLFVGGDVLFEGQRLVFRSEAVLFQDGVDLVDGHVEATSDHGQIGVDVVALLAHEEAGDRGIVVDDEAALAIENLAARSEDGDFADAVGFREGMVVLAADDLETPQAEDQHSHDGRNEVLDSGEAEGREFFVAVQHG